MTAFPASGYLSNAARTEGEMKTALEDFLAAVKQMPGAQAISTLTISAGAITPTRGMHAIDTESAAASDDLDTINTTNLPDGSPLWLISADATRNVVVRHNQGGAGRILLVDATNLTLDDPTQWLCLRRSGTDWVEVDRGYGLAKALARAFFGVGKETLAKSSTYTVVAADRSKLINCTSTLTLNLTAAATLGDGFEFEVLFSATSGTVTIDPNSTEQIDSGTTIVLQPGESCLVRCNGTAWQTIGRTSRAGILQGRHAMWLPASAWKSRVTNGAADGSVETSTNKINYDTKDFDQTTQEFIQAVIVPPPSWNRLTISFRAYWTAAAGSGAVVWGMQGVAISDDDVIDAAFGTAVEVTDTLLATTDLHWTAESGAITLAGSPAQFDGVVLQLYRDPADVADTLTADARLLGVMVFITLNAAQD